MTEPIKWLYYDLLKARFVDDDLPQQYFIENPESVLVEVHVDKDNPLPSGLGEGLVPGELPLLTRHNSELYEVNISGSNLIISSDGNDISEGFLPYSGGVLTGDIHPVSSGYVSIGKQTMPFDTVFSNNYFDKGLDPLFDNELVNKQYLQKQLLVGTKQVFSYVFTAATNYYTSVNSSSLTAVGTLYFRGSDVIGIPTSIKAILGHSSTGVQFQLYDLTNNNVIVDVTSTTSSPHIVDCGVISNVPTGEAILQFRLRRLGNNGQGRIYSLDVRV